MDETCKMSASPQVAIIEKPLFKLYQNGYNKSVNVMVDEIIKEYKIILQSGANEFLYMKTWDDTGLFMSPVFNDNSSSACKVNTILQPESSIKQFEYDVAHLLNELYGVYVHKSSFKYANCGKGWHYMKTVIRVSLEPLKQDIDTKY